MTASTPLEFDTAAHCAAYPREPWRRGNKPRYNANVRPSIYHMSQPSEVKSPLQKLGPPRSVLYNVIRE